MRRAERHRAEDAAAQTQIGAGPVTTGWLNYKDRPRQLHVFSPALLSCYRAHVDIVGRAFNAPSVNCQAHAGDVDAAGFCTEGVGVANLGFLERDYGDTAAVVNLDVVDADAIKGRIRSFYFSDPDARDRGSCLVRFRSEAQIVCLNALFDLRLR